MEILHSSFTDIWFVDFEFGQDQYLLPTPRCMVAFEINSGKKVKLFGSDLTKLPNVPFSIDNNCLFVSYYTPAELSCFLVLGWNLPTNILDLCVEFKNITNGIEVPCGRGLLGALTFYDLDVITTPIEKDQLRDLALRGGPYSQQEEIALLNYCESDVIALMKLFRAMLQGLDLSRALLRGRYMKALTYIERNGIPIDQSLMKVLKNSWSDIQDNLIIECDRKYGVFDGNRFNMSKWVAWLIKNKIAWPQLPSGNLAMDSTTFKEMTKLYPDLRLLYELRETLGKMRLNNLSIGADNRNRCMLSAFSSKTSRNQPSNLSFIFGPATWIRYLIHPPIGKALAYIDWCQQEFGIGAALSDDKAMREAYISGDPYLALAKQTYSIPKNATKESHALERELFKACALGVQYGMGFNSLAQTARISVIEARRLLQKHYKAFPEFWKWSESVVNHAMLFGWLKTVFGWTIQVGRNPNPRSLRNFPMQANGAEMLRLACCFATERGVKICAPIHDAILIEASIEEIDDKVKVAQSAMAEASRIILGGFELRSEVKIVKYPERYRDPRGAEMWEKIWTIIGIDPDKPIQN